MATLAEKRQLAKEWEQLLARHSKPLEKGAIAKGVNTRRLKHEVKRPMEIIRKVDLPKSLGTTVGAGTKAAPKVYTGTKIVGIATMHKSNMVPIFNEEAAVEVAQMRRN